MATPTKYITKIPLRIEQHQLTFDVQHTLFGEVREVKGDYLLLPEYARKLTYGKFMPIIERQIEYWETELPLFLPLVVMNVLRWSKLQQPSLGQVKFPTVLPAFESEKYLDLIEDSWIFQAWELHHWMPNYLVAFARMVSGNNIERRFASYYLYTVKEQTLEEKTMFGKFLLASLARFRRVRKIGADFYFLVPKFLMRNSMEKLVAQFSLPKEVIGKIEESYYSNNLREHRSRSMMYQGYARSYQKSVAEELPFEIKN